MKAASEDCLSVRAAFIASLRVSKYTLFAGKGSETGLFPVPSGRVERRGHVSINQTEQLLLMHSPTIDKGKQRRTPPF